MNLPKFIKDDERLFRLLLGDLFPSLELPVPEYGTLQVYARLNLVPYNAPSVASIMVVAAVVVVVVVVIDVALIAFSVVVVVAVVFAVVVLLLLLMLVQFWPHVRLFLFFPL